VGIDFTTFIFGGTSFMGPHVVRRLVAMGHDVTLFHRGQTEREDLPNVRHIHGDRTQLPRDLRAGLVIDMICMNEAEARAARERFDGVRYVVLSSGDVYRNYDGVQGRVAGAPDPVPLSEDAPLRTELYPYRNKAAELGDWVHQYDKILVERTLAGPRTTVLRMPAVYGPGDKYKRFFDWIDAMRRGDEAIKIGRAISRWRWTRGYVENMADAIVHAALDDRAAGRTYNVGDVDAPAEEEWLRMLARLIGWNGRIEYDDTPTPLHVDFHLATDTRRLRDELGWREHISRGEGLRRLIAWRRSSGPR
jgi:nucleoside-diphosphate-sugar epimerase